ncbi:hypothetical protein JAAARDRAFT_30330 [Jaapia argillacea MUCL 33604]|uniref:Uncharacterized protein n=1 Tax=Jaapia argillacea MUCL 33604 TaxID=933084 RepID=A0A067Q5X4_9AGAM|nr:hypothetical protein JAAARDRAFT_30330 [Jaapia argillacea MUCL 33604]
MSATSTSSTLITVTPFSSQPVISTGYVPSSTNSPFFSAPPTSEPSPPPNHDATSSSLYLFTFLATLFLLLFVSSAIVLRSFLLRRQFRRRIQAAIAAGVYLPPQAGPRRRNFGEKPKLWDYRASRGGFLWSEAIPFSAKTVSPNSLKCGGDVSARPNDSSSPSRATTGFRRIFRSPFSSRASPASASHSTTPNPSSSPRILSTHPSRSNLRGKEEEPQVSRVQISLLIAMPSPHRRNSSISLKGKERSSEGGWDEEEFPNVVIGVAEEACLGVTDGP